MTIINGHKMIKGQSVSPSSNLYKIYYRIAPTYLSHLVTNTLLQNYPYSEISIQHHQMISTRTYQIALHKSYDKIQYLYPMWRNSFVFLAHRNNGEDVFVYCKQDGKILFQNKFDDMVDTLAVINDKQAIVLMTRRNFIWIYNIQSSQVTKIPYQFRFEETDQSQIDCFSDTKMICIRQWGNYNDHRLKLSYFTLPLQLNSKPIAIYQSKENEWTHEYFQKRANNHSMIVWYKPRHDDSIQIHLHSLIFHEEKVLNNFQIVESSNSLAEYYGMKNLEVAITNMWEIRRDELFIVALTGRSDSVKSSQRISVNSTYIINIHTGNVKEIKIPINKIYCDFQIDQMYLGLYSMIRTFAFDNGRPKKTPIYYINNFSEEILAQEEWECSYMYKYFVPGYNGRMLVQCQYENHDVHQLVISLKQMTDPKLLGLHFLLQMYEDFDDDLLKQTVDFLPVMGEDN